MRIAVIHGPNLNLLGAREPHLYGHQTLEQINADLARFAATVDLDLTFLQSNSEAALVEYIQSLTDNCAGIVINAAGLTHTSVCLRDALVFCSLPFIEVHLSNVFAREPFRQTSLLSDVALGVISGVGPIGYELALRALLAKL